MCPFSSSLRLLLIVVLRPVSLLVIAVLQLQSACVKVTRKCLPKKNKIRTLPIRLIDVNRHSRWLITILHNLINTHDPPTRLCSLLHIPIEAVPFHGVPLHEWAGFTIWFRWILLSELATWYSGSRDAESPTWKGNENSIRYIGVAWIFQNTKTRKRWKHLDSFGGFGFTKDDMVVSYNWSPYLII